MFRFLDEMLVNNSKKIWLTVCVIALAAMAWISGTDIYSPTIIYAYIVIETVIAVFVLYGFIMTYVYWTGRPMWGVEFMYSSARRMVTWTIYLLALIGIWTYMVTVPSVQLSKSNYDMVGTIEVSTAELKGSNGKYQTIQGPKYMTVKYVSYIGCSDIIVPEKTIEVVDVNVYNITTYHKSPMIANMDIYGIMCDEL